MLLLISAGLVFSAQAQAGQASQDRETLASQIQSRPEIAMALLETLSGRIRDDMQTIGKLADHNKELRQRLTQAHDLIRQLTEQNTIQGPQADAART